MTENYNAIRGLMTTADNHYFIPYVDKVKCDGDGNEISETYVKKADFGGGYVDKNSITNCILEAPNGVMELAADGINFTLKQGLKVLIPNGRNADGTLKNIEITLSADNTYNRLSASSGNVMYYAFVDSAGGSHTTTIYQAGLSADKSKYIVSGNSFLYVALDLNKTLLYSSDTQTWSEVSWAYVGKLYKTSSGSTLRPEQPICLLKQSDIPLLMEWGMPDYSAGVDYANNTTVKTAPSNGVLVISYCVNAQTTGYFKINGKNIAANFHTSVYGTMVTGQYMLSKGDTFQITSVGSATTSIPFICRFYPCKGAK